MNPALRAMLLAALCYIFAVPAALAEIFVVSPSPGDSCAAGQPCTIQWIDNGVTPTLSSIGACTVGLYHGNMQLVQTLDPVNVGSVSSLTFTPQANAGENSANYYVAFISKAYKINGTSYIGYSPNIALTGMSGSFASPVASLTSAKTLPSSASSAQDTAIPVSTLSRTITVSFSSAPSASSTPTGLTTARTSSTASAPSASGTPSTASSGTASASVSASVAGSSSSSSSVTRPASILALILAPLAAMLF